VGAPSELRLRCPSSHLLCYTYRETVNECPQSKQAFSPFVDSAEKSARTHAESFNCHTFCARKISGILRREWMCRKDPRPPGQLLPLGEDPTWIRTVEVNVYLTVECVQ
jgi:hypothetical protein